MRILVTGSRGFIGNALLQHLRSVGHETFGAVRRSDLSDYEISCDLSDPQACAQLPHFDVVIHAAAIVASQHFSRTAMAVNVGGTERLLEWAASSGAQHFIHISSIAAYGLACLGQNRREDNTSLGWLPLNPAYLKSKALAERRVMARGVPFTTLRLPGVFGAFDTVSTPAIASSILSGHVPWVIRRDRIISTLYIRNLCSFVERLIARGPQWDAYNVSDGETTWEAFVEYYGRCLERPVPWVKHRSRTLLTHISNQQHQYLVTQGLLGAQFPSEKLGTVIDCEPPYDWRQGVTEGVEAYRSRHGDTAITAGLAAPINS